jgi:hypothetical protein
MALPNISQRENNWHTGATQRRYLMALPNISQRVKVGTEAQHRRYLQALPNIAQRAESVHICNTVMLPTGATFSPCSALPSFATQGSCQ